MREISINIFHYPEDDIWLAECDEIGLVTEAKTYDALVARALEIVSELAVENGVIQKNENLTASFVHSMLVAA